MDNDDNVYFGTDASKCTLIEKWRLTNGNIIAFLNLVWAGIIGRRWPSAIAIAHDSLEFKDVADIPSQVRVRIRSMWDQCEALGLRPHSSHRVDALGDAEGWTLTLVSQDQTIVCQLIYARVGELEQKTAVFLTALDDDTTLSTTNAPQRFNAPPGVLVKYLTDAPIRAVLEAHEERIEQLESAAPRQLNNSTVRKFILKLSRQAWKRLEERGIYYRLKKSAASRLRS